MAMPLLTRPPAAKTPEAPSPAQAAPAAPVLGIQHLCLDIENADAPKEVVDMVAGFYKPPPTYKNAKKIAAHEKASAKKLETKSALLDGAPISVLGVVTESSATIFHSIHSKKKILSIKDIPAEIFYFASERELLGAFREFSDPRYIPSTVIIGHNIKKYDLPKIRVGYVRNRLALPKIFTPAALEDGVRVFDTMDSFLRYFTAERAGQKFISQEEMVARLGLPGHKNRLSGAEIPGLIAQGKVEEVCAYNYLDCAEAYASYLAMTGQYKDQPQP